MKSTGNDIVALSSINKLRTCEHRFYSRILSASEQALYHQFQELPFEYYVWLLWSVKESAYKFLKRIKPQLLFAPVKIIIQDLKSPSQISAVNADDSHWSGACSSNVYSGSVLLEETVLYFRSKIGTEWIASVANGTDNFDNVYWGVQSFAGAGYQHQSKAAKELLSNKLNVFLSGALRVDKSTIGYPVILKDFQDMQIAASLAHHDQFVAYSFVK